MRTRPTCPDCGNNASSSMDDNGCHPADPAYLRLCVASVPEDEEDENGGICGAQWNPWEEEHDA
jgi:hypothetical protein